MQNINNIITKSIDSNNQCDKVIQSIAELNSQRVISILLPFLSLHSKTASAASHIARAYQLGSIWMGEASSRPTYDKSIDTLKLAGSVATSILFPSGQLVYSSIILFLEQAQKFSRGDRREKASSLYQIASQTVHLASIYYGTPKWVVLSLLSQAASEGYKAYTEERTPEAIASTLLAFIRGYKAGSSLYHDFAWAKKAEEEDWFLLLHKARKTSGNETPIDIKELLIKNGFSTLVEGISFHDFQFKNCSFKDITFRECSFYRANFENCKFDQVTAHQSSFSFSSWKESELKNSSFNACIFPQSSWLRSTFQNSSFSGCDFFKSSCIDLQLANLELTNCAFRKTQFDRCRFDRITAEKSDFSDSEFTNLTLNQFKAYKSSFFKVTFDSARLENSFFDLCNFALSYTIKSSYIKTTLSRCNLEQSDWIQSTFDQLILKQSKLYGSMFFQSSLTDCQIIHCDLDKFPIHIPDNTPKNGSNIEDLNGDLEGKIDARRYIMVDPNNNKYYFGSYFHGYGKYLVKGANLHFRRVALQNGSKRLELSFRVNHIFEERLRAILQGLNTMSPEEKRDFALYFQSSQMKVRSDAAYFVGKNCKIGDNASEVTLDGLGSLMLGPTDYYSFKNHVKVTLGPRVTLDSFHRFLSIFGLQDAVEKSSAEELEKIKMAVLFKTYFPKEAYDAEKEDAFFMLPLNQLKGKIIENIPAMKDLFEQQTVTKNELFPGCVRYGVKIDQAAYSQGARALTTAVMGPTNPEKLAMILKYGLLSHESRDRNGIIEGGINYKFGYTLGGAQSVFTQMISSQDVDKRLSFHAIGYQSPIRLLISLEALDLNPYQFFLCLGGRKDSEHYRSRPALLDFIVRRSEWEIGHEVMIPRVLPEHIKAMIVNSQELKDQLISQFKKSGLILNNRINGIPIDAFIHTEEHLTPDMVKRCY